MKEAISGLMSSFDTVIGTSKIVPLFLVSLLFIIFLNKENKETKRRRINPTVFLLSIWSGIAHAFVEIVASANSNKDDKGNKKPNTFAIILFFVVAVVMSGGLVFTDIAYENSIYYFTDIRVTVIATVAIVSYFAMYFLISGRLYENRTDRFLFMIAVILLHTFEYYSAALLKISIFMSPLSIPSIVVHDVLPFILLCILNYEEDIKAFINRNSDVTSEDNLEEIEEGWDLKKHKILNIRNLTAVLAVLVLIFAGAVFVLNSKINSLYDATVLLENAANDKASIHELKDGNSTVATLIISSDGDVTVIGGGDSSNGNNLHEMINKYSEGKVTKWYLLGDDEENRGAYNFCKDMGINISSTYVINGIEEK